MIRIELEKVIQRPIDEVFDRLVDINGYSNWLPKSSVFIDTRLTSDGPVGLGTTFKDQTRIGVYLGEVTAFERPTKVGFRMRLRWLGVTVMESRPEYHLQPLDGGTKVCQNAVGQLYGLFKLVEPYVERMAWEERERTLTALKKSLE